MKSCDPENTALACSWEEENDIYTTRIGYSSNEERFSKILDHD